MNEMADVYLLGGEGVVIDLHFPRAQGGDESRLADVGRTTNNDAG